MCSINANKQTQKFSYDAALMPMAAGIMIKRAREARRLTQLGLAARSGMSVSYISNIENGQNNISLAKLGQICSSLEIPASLIMALSEQLMPPLGAAIQLRTPREAERLIQNYLPEALNVAAAIANGFMPLPLPDASLQALERAVCRRLRDEKPGLPSGQNR